MKHLRFWAAVLGCLLAATQGAAGLSATSVLQEFEALSPIPFPRDGGGFAVLFRTPQQVVSVAADGEPVEFLQVSERAMFTIIGPRNPLAQFMVVEIQLRRQHLSSASV